MLRFCLGVRDSVRHRMNFRQNLPRSRVLRIRRERGAHLFFGAREVPVVARLIRADDGTGFRELRIDLQRHFCRGPRFRKRIGGREMAVDPERHVSLCDTGMRERICRIELDRLTKILNRFFQSLLRPLRPVKTSP